MKLLTINDFCYKYQISEEQLRTYYYRNKKAFARKNKVLMVNETFFVRRKNFQVKIWNEAFALYYFLKKKMDNSDISQLLTLIEVGKVIKNKADIWNAYLTKQVFKSLDSEVIFYEIGVPLWKFWRMAKWAVHMMFRKCGVPRNKRNLERVWND
ncbi:MAG: hypothetical protein QG559_1557 [Campylobacterota bacterium]|nr:hypothetical protein [Campylobacterota bacterium]